MEWKNYFQKVVQCQMVIIKGWPNAMPFKNLSEISSTFVDPENLFNMWQTGQTYWKMITEDEPQALEKKRQEQIDAGEITAPIECRCCSDYGKKHKQIGDKDGEDQIHWRSKKHKSVDTIKSDDDAPSCKSAAIINPCC